MSHVACVCRRTTRASGADDTAEGSQPKPKRKVKTSSGELIQQGCQNHALSEQDLRSLAF